MVVGATLGPAPLGRDIETARLGLALASGHSLGVGHGWRKMLRSLSRVVGIKDFE